MHYNSKRGLSSDRLGASTVAIAIVAILVIAAAGAGVFFLTKTGGNVSEEGATFEEPGIGTVMKYKMAGTESDATEITINEYVAENTDSYVVCEKRDASATVEGTKIFSKSDEFVISEKGSMLPADAVAAGTETISTCDGSVETTKYTSASFHATYWVGNDDSGKKNNAIYKVESEAIVGSNIAELVSYTLKKHVDYVPSEEIGQEYARYTDDEGSSVQATYFAESADYYCIAIDIGYTDINLLLSKTSEKAPYSFADKGAGEVVIDDETYDTKCYAKTVGESNTAKSDYKLDLFEGDMFVFTVVNVFEGLEPDEQTYTIVLQ